MFIQEPFNLTGGVAGGGAGYSVDYSCRFDYLASDPRLHRTQGTSSTPEIQTVGAWFKLGTLGGAAGDRRLITVGDYNKGVLEVTLRGASFANRLQVTLYSDAGGSSVVRADPNSLQLFRDPHAWYHICITYDTTPVTPIFKFFLNNEEVTAWDDGSGAFDGIQTDDTFSLNSNSVDKITLGANNAGTGSNFDGYMSQWFCLDGTTVATPADGGIVEVDDNGVVRPANLTGLTFGAEGWLLDFADSSDLGNDVSGNNNDFTSTDLAAADRVPDTPTNNWATLSSVSGVMGAGAVTLSNGNLDTVGTVSTSSNNTICSHTVTSGKWIWGVKPGTPGQAQNSDPWIFDISSGRDIYVNTPKSDAAGWGSSMDTTSTFVTYHDGGNRSHTVSPIFATNDLHLMAADIDNLKLWCGYYDASADTTNWMDGGTGITGDPGAGTDQTWTLTGTHFAFGTSTYGTRTGQIDFGQRTGIIDQITIPTGFQFLNTTNLAVPAIVDPSIYAQAYNYTGTGLAHTETLNGNSEMGTLDMLVLKDFSTTDQPRLFAAHSEMGNTKAILMANYGAIETDADGVTSIGAENSFVLGTGAGGFNDDGDSFSSYCFHVAKTAEAPASPAGSIASKVIVNGSAGWSMGTWEGTEANATIGHGLSVKPNFLLISSLDDAGEAIPVGFTGLGWTKNIGFTGALPAAYTDSTAFQDLAPTDSIFYVGSNPALNDSGGTMFFFAAYDIAGFSTWGHTYSPNADADGPLALYGFSAEFIWLMRIVGATVWSAIDIIRSPYNETVDAVRINDNTVGTTSNVDMDVLSNGLKIRSSGGDVNDNGADFYIFACAKNPFGGHGGTFGSGVSPATAR